MQWTRGMTFGIIGLKKNEKLMQFKERNMHFFWHVVIATNCVLHSYHLT